MSDSGSILVVGKATFHLPPGDIAVTLNTNQEIGSFHVSAMTDEPKDSTQKPD